jgi:acyl-CoA synthetase (AMP-forming)/AMP-acid ligase II
LEFEAAAERFAAALVHNAAFANGERCVLFLDNRVETAVGIFGTLRAGGVFSVINPSTKADKLAFVLNNCEASVLLTQTSLLPQARNACVTCRATERPNRGDISGAVTKSLPELGIRPNLRLSLA